LILPTKHLTPAESLLGVSARLLERLEEPRTVNQLWDSCRGDRRVGTFDRFVLGLDLLFVLGAIDVSAGTIRAKR
jgi:hypothetical protein